MLWLAFTVIAVASVARATLTINARAVAQTNADSVALVAVDRGIAVAKDFARAAHIDVVELTVADNSATATVRDGSISASSSAMKPK